MCCRLSVIIPAYNADKYIGKCLDTVIAQDIDSMEMIVVNDGSTDQTMDIVKQYELGYPNIRVISTANKGVSHARNIGLRKAKGRYITFVDADDYIEPGMYRKMLAILEQYDADLVECSCRKVKPNGNLITEMHLKRTILEGKACLSHYLQQKAVLNYVVNKIYKCELMEGKRFPLMKYSEDYYMNVLLHEEAGRKVIIPDVFYNYVIHNDSACGRKAGLDRIDGVRSGIRVMGLADNKRDRHYAALYVCRYCLDIEKSMENPVRRQFVRQVRWDFLRALSKIKIQFIMEDDELGGYLDMLSFVLKR